MVVLLAWLWAISQMHVILLSCEHPKAMLVLLSAQGGELGVSRYRVQSGNECVISITMVLKEKKRHIMVLNIHVKGYWRRVGQRKDIV